MYEKHLHTHVGHERLKILESTCGSPVQDDMSILKTPLHISASLGHAEVVRVLLAAKAQVSHSFPGGGGPPELKDAVDGCHVEARWDLAASRIFQDRGTNLFGH